MLHSQASNVRAAQHQHQLNEVQKLLSHLQLIQEKQEDDLRKVWKQREKALWDRIENGIKLEEEKSLAKAEALRRQQEEEERLRRETEEKERLEKERQLQEAVRKQQEDEEKQKQKEMEEAEKKLQSELQKKKAEQEQTNDQERKTLGMTTASQDWEKGRDILKVVHFGYPQEQLLIA